VLRAAINCDFGCRHNSRLLSKYTNAVLESAIRQAVRRKMLAEDPCVGVDLSGVKRKEMEALSVDECRRFLEVTEKSEWFPLLVLALPGGMRPSEYLALKWSDIDWQLRGSKEVDCISVLICATHNLIQLPRLMAQQPATRLEQYA